MSMNSSISDHLEEEDKLTNEGRRIKSSTSFILDENH